jgi:hypothetical protein
MGDKATEIECLGWREWVSLPELGIKHLKAKVDTGARTSALHAFALERSRKDGKDYADFKIHPFQRNTTIEQSCRAEVVDVRKVTDSGGHREERLVITTPIEIAGDRWDIELTLTERDSMMFRMLLGRTAIRDRFKVDPGRSFLAGKPTLDERRPGWRHQ